MGRRGWNWAICSMWAFCALAWGVPGVMLRDGFAMMSGAACASLALFFGGIAATGD